ncbi:MAG: PEGA domain-containing protein, partial [Desulfurivibrio sp.]
YEPEIPWYEDAPPPPAGRLLLLVKPLLAEATLNGYQLLRHPDLSFEVGLLPGEYQLKITAAGYKPLERKVRIRGGERLHLTISLEHDSEP